MNLFAIYGNPVHHSKSPLMHNYAFQKLGVDACYTRILLEDGSSLKNDFFARKLQGANVTVPHKEAAFIACDEVRGFAKTVGVVNTLILEEGKLIGYNTDADGFMFAMQSFNAPIRSILVLGAGGTAKALVTKFLEESIDVTVINRSKKRLQAFTTLSCKTDTWDTFIPKSYDLVLNTTSAGLEDDALPAPIELLKQVCKNTRFAADAIYGKETPFLKLVKSYNLPNIDGEAMLVGQGVLANIHFTHNTFNPKEIEKHLFKALTF